MSRALPFLVALLVLLAWWALSLTQPEILLPGPMQVLEAGWTGRVRLGTGLLNTALSSLGGLAIASGIGLGGATLFLRFPWLERAFYPYALFMQTVPIIAIAPVLVVWLGYGASVALCTAAIVCFFPILSSANAGLSSPSRSEVELLQLYGASWTQTLIKLRLPRALPTVLAGYRSAVGLSVIGAIVGEFVGATGDPVSLGYLVISSSRSADTATTFAAVCASAVLAGILFATVRAIEGWAIGAWHGHS